MRIRSRLGSQASDRGVRPTRTLRRSLVLLVVVAWSGFLGWGLQAAMPQAIAQTTPAQPSAQPAPTQTAPAAPDGTTDPVPERYQLGQQLYLENCATCHVGLPPAVLPATTWAEILPDASHYGVQITPATELTLKLIWQYVSTYSRPLNPEEQTPYRLQQSRYFKALHPKVEFPQPVSVSSCAACHPAAAQFNYRTLSPDWENAP